MIETQREAEELGIVCSLDPSFEGIIPWQELIPMTKKQKEDLLKQLTEMHNNGEINLDDFSSSESDYAERVGGAKWKAQLDSYFQTRGTTTEEYWKKMGYDPSMS